jgi:hypothetical protein
MDRESVAMSLPRSERAAATTAHLVGLVFSIPPGRRPLIDALGAHPTRHFRNAHH